ncbi:carbohydrate ABC transporter permease [Halopenitus salinus]|uniref:Carbohydrate ABC transporter permease n=1 Tax=Halopenitus salinus TaxID=1198295 RepID=A0ABD5UQ17_9EURY
MTLVNKFDRWLGDEVGPKRGVIIYAALALYYSILLLPILYFVLSTFKGSEVIRSQQLILIPIESFTLEHWIQVITRGEFRTYFLNSTIVATGTTILSVGAGTFASYSISRMDYPGRRSLILGYLGTEMLPRVLILIPFFVIMYNLDIIDTYVGIIIAHTVIALPFVTWLLKGYFDDIPTALDDAAKMDGCSDIQTLFHIILPLALPGIAVSAFYTFIVSWNDYLFVSIISRSQGTRTLPFALQLFQSQNTVDWGAVLTAATITMLPVVILFAIIQSYLVEGLTSGGMKGY